MSCAPPGSTTPEGGQAANPSRDDAGPVPVAVDPTGTASSPAAAVQRHGVDPRFRSTTTWAAGGVAPACAGGKRRVVAPPPPPSAPAAPSSTSGDASRRDDGTV